MPCSNQQLIAFKGLSIGILLCNLYNINKNITSVNVENSHFYKQIVVFLIPSLI